MTSGTGSGLFQEETKHVVARYVGPVDVLAENGSVLLTQVQTMLESQMTPTGRCRWGGIVFVDETGLQSLRCSPAGTAWLRLPSSRTGQITLNGDRVVFWRAGEGMGIEVNGTTDVPPFE
jgi:hypothetical protein